MRGTVVEIENDPRSGPVLGARIDNSTFPIPPYEGDTRMLKPDDEVIFITTREGSAEIIEPKPLIGCKRER